MKKKEKRMIAILVAITLIVIIVVIVVNMNKNNINISNENNNQELNKTQEEFVNKSEDGTRYNTSNKLKEIKTVDGMEISDLQISEKDNVSLLLGTVKNVSDTEKGGYPLEIRILDKQGNEMITIGAYIGELKAGETAQLSTSATFDYANAYDFVISKKEV